MQTIRLSREWRFDETKRLGPPGGFGEVFAGEGAEGAVAVKRLKLTAGAAAYREMKIGGALASRTLSHVVPVLDCGQDADSDGYFLIMPVCDGSLQDEINGKGPLTLTEVREATMAILNGLVEVGDIVHRDLKPGNVLRLDGTWRLADFGIAKFVEDSTSLQTLRGSLTPAYGAPEQWEGLAPTRATDVYALGCMLHTMLTGAPPFTGSHEDIRKAHLEQTPPTIATDARLAGFINQMLRKSPESRPSVKRCLEVIGSIETSSARPHNAKLIEAANKVGAERAAAEAAAQAAETARRQRQRLFQEAAADLRQILERLVDEIVDHSEEARKSGAGVSLGNAIIEYSDASQRHVSPKPIRQGHYGVPPEPDIVGGTNIMVKRAAAQMSSYDQLRIDQFGMSPRNIGRDTGYSWTATLFYAKFPGSEEYRWYEAGFWTLSRRQADLHEPFGVDPSDDDFPQVFGNMVSTVNLAYGPFPIDAEDEEGFRARWISLFTKAVDGNLNRPSSMPIHRSFFDQL